MKQKAFYRGIPVYIWDDKINREIEIKGRNWVWDIILGIVWVFEKMEFSEEKLPVKFKK